MPNSSIIGNIIQSSFSVLSDSSIQYLLYDDSVSIFDKVVANSNNIITIPINKRANFFTYNAYWSNSPTNHISSLSYVSGEHIKDIVYFRDKPHANVKKEDKFLIQNRLANSIKIIRNQEIKSDWHIKEAYDILEYGVPKCDINNTRQKSVLVINTLKNKTIDIIYNEIKKQIPDTDIIRDIANIPFEDIADMMQNYKVCIDFEDEYNILVAVANGCRTISTKKINNCNYIYIQAFDNISELLSIINYELSKSDSYDREKSASEVTSYYNFELFETKLYNIIKETTRKPFLI